MVDSVSLTTFHYVFHHLMMQFLMLLLYSALTGVIVAHPDGDILAEVQRRAEPLAYLERRTLANFRSELMAMTDVRIKGCSVVIGQLLPSLFLFSQNGPA